MKKRKEMSTQQDTTKSKLAKQKQRPKATKTPRAKLQNAFIIFSNEVRSKAAAANPHLPNAQVSKIVGQMWHNLTEEQRSVYAMKSQGMRLQGRGSGSGSGRESCTPAESSHRGFEILLEVSLKDAADSSDEVEDLVWSDGSESESKAKRSSTSTRLEQQQQQPHGPERVAPLHHGSPGEGKLEPVTPNTGGAWEGCWWKHDAMTPNTSIRPGCEKNSPHSATWVMQQPLFPPPPPESPMQYCLPSADGSSSSSTSFRSLTNRSTNLFQQAPSSSLPEARWSAPQAPYFLSDHSADGRPAFSLPSIKDHPFEGRPAFSLQREGEYCLASMRENTDASNSICQSSVEACKPIHWLPSRNGDRAPAFSQELPHSSSSTLSRVNGGESYQPIHNHPINRRRISIENLLCQ
mmetsp:Transcript_19913/g.32670  ORF Transcript_19913/g.32670 Transcript_19913/m.32670 type:complete len:407 (-) Transcript_19913:831-2051(-)|eukprot:CAMPEP_0184658972 /NCGR_PEP_ID=MMETSP0308-20130426/27609_1 /TAXON_ID=38269 /ORGANISM="Gloeochaete witrockiana, Strain SAG 46.84" /LENGTH=406 /DNA_ID=CAMNT_0027098377 /DNA_START=103 /DNA_END=1323 /DNA_ORIENTATION=+